MSVPVATTTTVSGPGRGFLAAIFAASAFVVGFSAANVYYFYQLRQGRTLTHGEIQSMLIVNVVLLVIGLIVLIYALYLFIVGVERHRAIVASTTSYLAAPPTGVIPTSTTVVTPVVAAPPVVAAAR